MWLLGLFVGCLVSACLPVRAVFVGSPCQQSSDCAQLNSSHCHEGLCACKAGYVQSLGKTVCIPQVIGRSCISRAQVCDVKHSYCDNGVCACVRPTHVASYNKTTCLPAVHVLRGECFEDQQCANEVLGQDTMCIDRECVCRYGATDVSKPCEPMKIATRLGSPCRQHVQCTAAFGEGGVCSEDGRCQCLGRFHFVHNRTVSCVVSRGLSDTCALSDECWLPLDGGHANTECVGGVCVCRKGLEPTDYNRSCSGSGVPHSLFSASQIIALAFLTTTATTLLGLGI